MTREVILARVAELLLLRVADDNMSDPDSGHRVMEMYQGALQLSQLVYGPRSPQEAALTTALGTIKNMNGASLQIAVQPAAMGTLKAIQGDVTYGILGSIAQRGAGEALADFMSLAREALSAGGSHGTNIAAVLAAAVYEDTLRRLGSAKGGVRGRPKLSEVVESLRSAGVLQGAAGTVALSYLKFRNDAMHADWSGTSAPVVESCLGFVQGLLLEHFS